MDFELSVNEADATEVKNHFDSHGQFNSEAFHTLLEKKKNEWVDIPVHVAISGNLGAGKSSFINAIRGVKPEDKNGAVLNSGLTTIEPIPYSHPNKHYLKFWDLPQLGSPAFSEDKYLQNSNFNKYDFFIIIARSKFTDADIWFAQQIQAAHKKVFFVRSHFDLEAQEALETGQNADPREVIGSLMKRVQEGLGHDLKHAKLKLDQVFLISTEDTRKYDFPKLATQMIVNLPEGKWEAMSLSISVLADGVIKQKRRALQKRVWIIAIMSMIGETRHIYRLPYELNIETVKDEVREYRRQFGLDEGSLLRLARSIDITKENLKQSYKTNYTQLEDSGMLSYYINLSVFDVADGITKSFLPILGNLIGGNCAFGSTYHVLNKLLDLMETDALKILEFVRYRNAEV